MNIKKLSRVVAFLAITLAITSCSTTQEPQNMGDTTIGKVDNEEIPLSELKAYYEPPANADTVTYDSLLSFMPSYLDFKVKLQAAKDAGYFTQPDFHSELQDFGRQSSYSYWLENEVNEELFQEFKDRREEMISASQLLVRLPPNATPSDTQRVYNRLMEARKKFQGGHSFDKLVEKYASRTNKGQKTGGPLGYFSAGSMVKSFEDAAYSLSIDSVSKPIRTQFGYHLIVVTERKQRPPDRKISHIFFRPGNGTVENAMEKAERAHEALQDGMPWSKAVKEFSEDRSSINSGGQIGWVNYGKFREGLIDSVYAIDTVGKPTHPILTSYGLHIFKVDSVRSFDTDEQYNSHLNNQLKKLPRYKNRRNMVLQKVRKAENATVIKPVEIKILQQFRKQPDTVKLTDFSLPDSIKNMVHYTIGDSSYTAGYYVDWLGKNYPESMIKPYKNKWFNSYVDFITKRNLIPATLKRFPGFAVEYNKFKNSLAVFQITQDSVWNYNAFDSTTLKKHYRENKASYRFKKRYFYTSIASRQDSIVQRAKKLMQEGTPVDSLRKRISNVRVKRDSITVDFLSDDPFNQLKGLSPKTYSKLFEHNNLAMVLYLHKIEPPRAMTFDEAYQQVVSDYRTIREEKWMKSLHDKYDVASYPDKLKEVMLLN